LAEPSTTANESTITPIARVRGSSHADPGFDGVGSAGVGGRNAPAAQTSSTSASTQRTPMCTTIGTRAAAIGMPTPAPAMLPKLHPAWNRGMIVRSRRRSTSAASTFIATSQTPMPTPYTNSPTAVGGTDSTTPAPKAAVARPAADSTPARRTTAAALHRSISRPLEGRASTEPAEIASSSRPRDPFARPRSPRTSGNRETSVANRKPLRANVSATKLRVVVRVGTRPSQPMPRRGSKSTPSRRQAPGRRVAP
jgi:hypothetical protein